MVDRNDEYALIVHRPDRSMCAAIGIPFGEVPVELRATA